MTDTSGSFFPSAEERRAVRDRIGRGIAYFIPPELRQLGTFLADATPSAALERAGSASMEAVAPDRTMSERLGSVGRALSDTAGVAAPVFAGRAIPSAEAAQEVFMGISAPMRSATETFFERMNQPGPMPERLMSGVDPLAAFRAAREAMLGASNETPFEDLVELSSRQSAARDAVVEALSGERNVRLFDPQGRGVVVGEGMGPGEEGRFRVTYFNADQRPTNHTVYETREEALNAALQEGFTLPTADRGSRSFDPEADIRNLRQARDIKEAELEYNNRIGGGYSPEQARADVIRLMGIDPVSGTAARGPENYAEGGAVMMRSDMSKQLQGGIGGFANRAKNMFNEGGEVEREEREGPSLYERIKGDQYWISPNPGVRDAATTEEDKIDLLKQMGLVMTAQAGGEVGRGQGQGSTTGRPVSGPAAGVNLGADDDLLTSVRNRVMRQSGVDPLRIAMDEGVDPDLFLRLIAQESGGRADAQSDAGAYGFTQLMDATARELGVDRTDPVQNLRGGARYLRQQLDRFQDVPLALAAYNAGPNAVERFGGIPPYSETRAYVSRILGLPGGEMGVSPPMRPDPIVPTPRPAIQGPMLDGDPLGQLGNVLATTPLQVPAQAPAMPEQEQPMIGQPPQTQFTRNDGMPGERLFMDLMRNMP